MTLLRISSLAFIALLAAACQPDTEATGADQEPLEYTANLDALEGLPGAGPLIPQGSPLVNKIYRAESKSWLRWAMGLPFSTGPITDTTGAACAQGQVGPVWYLAGTSGGDVTRACTIPRNKFLVIPLINNWVLPLAEQVDTPEELSAYLDFVDGYIPDLRAHTCNLALKLDGAPLLATEAELDEKLWVEVLQPFSVDVDEDNFASAWGRPGGVSPAAATGGHYALLRPLSRGSHTLEVAGSLCDDDGTLLFENSAVYHLTVSH